MAQNVNLLIATSPPLGRVSTPVVVDDNCAVSVRRLALTLASVQLPTAAKRTKARAGLKPFSTKTETPRQSFAI